jgi:hypothetical protein
MPEATKEKLTLAFNEYESEQLNSIQMTYLFGKGWYSLIPSVNDILKGIIIYASFETKDKRVLRGFSNNFLRRRNLPPSEEESENNKDIDEEESEAGLKVVNMGIEDKPIGEVHRFVRPKSGNYSFYFDEKDISIIENIKKLVAERTNIALDKITSPEIVRECLHLVLDNRYRNLDYRYVTYLGFLYSLRPVISVILARMSKENHDESMNELISLLQSYAKPKEIETILSLHSEKKLFEKFEKAYFENPSIKNESSIEKMFGEYISNMGGFDYYLAFLGADMLYYASKTYIKEIPDILLYIILNSSKTNLGFTLSNIGIILNAMFETSDFLNKSKQMKIN